MLRRRRKDRSANFCRLAFLLPPRHQPSRHPPRCTKTTGDGARGLRLREGADARAGACQRGRQFPHTTPRHDLRRTYTARRWPQSVANPSGSRATVRRVQGGRHSGAQADEVTICAKSNFNGEEQGSRRPATLRMQTASLWEIQVARSSINPTLVAPRDLLDTAFPHSFRLPALPARAGNEPCAQPSSGLSASAIGRHRRAGETGHERAVDVFGQIAVSSGGRRW